ncbi:MAG: FKBP-type peptidyl-prolyl cis-trans isomerase [Bacteroides sp.]|nr:FKBP-type peptidyl-prolyl cis-trans isomerase [Bacteroides sp.]MCM1413776.1 FKBP-type peptidyl-prolyl cis-trans isomerase [Bacteroides sp.]MCM1472205.1 FKBP-type peptidyl-prolyl cis-trans isomerase [Bacteroides sp.]
MKTKVLLAGLFLAAVSLTSCKGGAKGADAPEPKTFEDSVAMLQGIAFGSDMLATYQQLPDSVKAKFDRDKFLAGIKLILDADTTEAYQSGIQIGLNLLNAMQQGRVAGVDLDPNMLYSYFAETFMADSVDSKKIDGMRDRFEPIMTRYQDKLQTYAYESQIRYQAQMQKMFDKNVAEGTKFMADLKAKDPEVKTTASGLSYKVTKMGTGEVAKEGEVPVIYTGKFIDGTVFDSSNNEVVPFAIDGVVPGFKEALTTFPAGTQVTLYVPYDLGYGANGSSVVQPGQTMIFDMEICEK